MFSLPSLGFGYDELEPFFDHDTMFHHHAKFHQSIVADLNRFPIDATKWRDDIEELFSHPRQLSGELKELAGAHYNHSFFWSILSPPGECGVMSERFSRLLINSFGSLSDFMSEFERVALKCNSPGWAWLVLKNDKMAIMCTRHNQNPLMADKEGSNWPLLVIDLWEHAYYLKYHGNKGNYLKAFWSVVNWRKVEELYEHASQKN